MHKFVIKYRFKWSWDVIDKIFKEAILNSEFRYERCASTFEYYMKMKQHLNRNGEEESTQKVLKYEVQQDT